MAPSRRRLLLAFAGSLLVPAAVACNGIIGLSDYKRVECNGGEVCDGGGGPDVLVDGSPDGDRPDVVGVDASGTSPVSWAHFKMPNYLQVGGPTENIQSYSPTDGGFLDNVSKLVWQEPIVDKGEKTWDEAQKICAGITQGGKWRLPSRIELVTLLDLTKSPTIDTASFLSTEGTAYWTTSEVRPIVKGAVIKHWTVEFGTGGLGMKDENLKAAVRCIKDR